MGIVHCTGVHLSRADTQEAVILHQDDIRATYRYTRYEQPG